MLRSSPGESWVGVVHVTRGRRKEGKPVGRSGDGRMGVGIAGRAGERDRSGRARSESWEMASTWRADWPDLAAPSPHPIGGSPRGPPLRAGTLLLSFSRSLALSLALASALAETGASA